MFMREFIIPFTTGLAIFLFGMQVMKIGFENLFIDKIKVWLARLTKNTWTGMLTGTITTAILQSSSAVTLLTIALTNSRLLSFRQALGIILGANIGTCLTTELIAIHVEQWSIYIVLIGFVLFLSRQIKVRCAGLCLGGFGLLFVGMKTMQSITPMVKISGLMEAVFMYGQDGLISGIAAGTLLTALIQSSTATTAITMNLINEQLLTIHVAIAIILGSNIGTCVTALLGSIGSNRASKQVAVSHILLNVGGVLLFYFFIPVLVQAVQWMTPYPMQQVAHAQTIFNILCSFIVLPFASYFERVVLWLVRT